VEPTENLQPDRICIFPVCIGETDDVGRCSLPRACHRAWHVPISRTGSPQNPCESSHVYISNIIIDYKRNHYQFHRVMLQLYTNHTTVGVVLCDVSMQLRWKRTVRLIGKDVEGLPVVW